MELRNVCRFIACMAIMLCFNSCKDKLEQDASTVDSSAQWRQVGSWDDLECEDDADLFLELIPIASMAELALYADMNSYHTGVLDYKFARDYAYAELQANLGMYFNEKICEDLEMIDVLNSPENLLLASRPVVVYDYEDKPYYYEFPVMWNGRVISTVTVAAQPHTDEIIHYLFPAALSYKTYDFQYRRYIGNYPNVYYGMGDGIYYQLQQCDIDNICLEEVYGEFLFSNPYEALLNKFTLIPYEDRMSMNTDLEESIDGEGEVEGEDEELEYRCLDDLLYALNFPKDYTDFWWAKIFAYNEINTASEDISNCQFSPLTDAVMAMIEEQLNEVSNSVVGFLPEYDNHYLRLTTWSDACGPAIMSWLYRGKYDSYNGYLPIFGEEFDANEHEWYWAYSTHSVYMMSGTNSHDKAERERMSLSTDYGLYYAFYYETLPAGSGDALYHGGMVRGLRYVTDDEYTVKFIVAPIKWMEEKQQPVVVEGIRGRAHYWGAIGYGYNETVFGTKKHMRLFVTDNGYTLSDHNYYPYWSILGGLNYGWKQNY